MKQRTFFCLFLSFCFASPVSAEITIGVTASLQGAWAQLGVQIVRGAELAASEIHAEGGIAGEDIHLLIENSDEAESPKHLLSAYKSLRQRKVDIILGPTGSAGALALLPIIEREGVLVVSPSVGVQEGVCSSRGNFFNIQGGWEQATKHLMQSLQEKLQPRIAIVGAELPFEQAQAIAANNKLVELGHPPVQFELTGSAHDFRAEMAKVLSKNPNLIFLSLYNELGLAARQLRNLGFKGEIATIQVDESRLLDAQGALEGVYFSSLSEASQEFSKKYQARYGELPAYPADYAYDALHLIAEALRETKSRDPEKLKRFLEKRRVRGASGDFQFDACGHAQRSSKVVRLLNGKGQNQF